MEPQGVGDPVLRNSCKEQEILAVAAAPRQTVLELSEARGTVGKAFALAHTSGQRGQTGVSQVLGNEPKSDSGGLGITTTHHAHWKIICWCFQKACVESPVSGLFLEMWY